MPQEIILHFWREILSYDGGKEVLQKKYGGVAAPALSLSKKSDFLPILVFFLSDPKWAALHSMIRFFFLQSTLTFGSRGGGEEGRNIASPFWDVVVVRSGWDDEVNMKLPPPHHHWIDGDELPNVLLEWVSGTVCFAMSGCTNTSWFKGHIKKGVVVVVAFLNARNCS